MSYFDETDVERFKIILRSFQYSRIDKWYVQVNNEQGVGQLTTFIKEIPIEYKMEVPVKMTSLDFSDVTWIEKEIKKMIKMVYNF